MDSGTIVREVHIDATPDVVYEVITKPEHIAQWWGFDASFPALPGGDGRMTKQRRDGMGTLVVSIHVVEADAPRRFVFRWVHPEDQPATPQNFVPRDVRAGACRRWDVVAPDRGRLPGDRLGGRTA
ncbi:SRPBCC domain-containing protein [Nonomuraea basaltis]|uniref:SRPBCC domain-containing protein n=1 Tax=Nonomuraea basaltis TaxID=2495887 RepID=UPI00197F4CCC|nr:SRPBCC domain-containing protein [Nonomuraea basaltis]